MSWRRWGSVGLCVAAFAAGGADFSGCSSQALPDGGGGSAGSTSGEGGHATGIGGRGTGGTGVGGAISGNSPGSCIPNHVNPDVQPGGACASDCQSVSCGRPCTEDCCVTCGIDALGARTCTCLEPGLPYSNCTCAPPANIPPGLQGGPCSPQGYASTTPPPTAPPGTFSLRGMPCRALNLVCFTSESTSTSERGCICMADGLMHCGSVNHWFANDGVTTAWMP